MGISDFKLRIAFWNNVLGRLGGLKNESHSLKKRHLYVVVNPGGFSSVSEKYHINCFSSAKSFRDSKVSFGLETTVIWFFHDWVSCRSPAAA